MQPYKAYNSECAYCRAPEKGRYAYVTCQPAWLGVPHHVGASPSHVHSYGSNCTALTCQDYDGTSHARFVAPTVWHF